MYVMLRKYFKLMQSENGCQNDFKDDNLMIKICLSLKGQDQERGKDRKEDVVGLPGFISRLVIFPS